MALTGHLSVDFVVLVSIYGIGYVGGKILALVYNQSA